MPYGTIKVDTITFTDAGVDKSIAISGLVQNPTFTGNVTVTGTVSGTTIRGTTVSGVTVTGTTANFASGVFTTQISGAIYVAPAGTAGAPSIQVGTGTTVVPGFYSSAIDQLAISTGGASRIVVDSVGQLRIIGAGSAGAPALITGNDLTTGLFSGGTGQLALSTGGSERLRVDASGRLLLGATAGRAIGTGTFPQLLIEGLVPAAFIANRADSVGGVLSIGKSRGTTAGSTTIVAQDDSLGEIRFAGADGSTATSIGASIIAYVDGVPGLNDMPGRLVFATTADGASTATERMRIDNAGRVSIGTADTSVNLVVSKNIDTAASAYGTLVNGVIQSGVTSNAVLFGTGAATVAAAFTLAELRHFDARQNTIGVGSTVNNQYGYYATASLTGATNNYGFYGNIASGTNRWNFYAAGTADSYFNSNNFIFANGGSEKARVDSSGRLLVGTSTSIPSTSGLTPLLQVHGTSSNGSIGAFRWSADSAQSFVVLSKSRGASVSTRGAVVANDVIGQLLFTGDDGTSFIQLAGISAAVDGTPGLNDMPGRLIFSTTADGNSSLAERMRIDNTGRIGIGGTPTFENLGIYRTITGGTTAFSCYTQSVIQSDVTAQASYYVAVSQTAASAFTAADVRLYNATQGTFGVGSTVTNQFGYFAAATLIGATNNYGFYSNIPSGTGRWNFYAANSAPNYFSGNVGIGLSSTPTVNLDVSSASGSTIRVTDTSVTGLTVGRFVATYTGGGGGTQSNVELRAGDAYTYLVNTTNTPLLLGTNGLERARIDSSGRLLVGTSSARTAFYGTNITGNILQVEKVDNAGATFVANFNDAFARGFIVLAKSRGAILGSNTAVQSGDNVGELVFAGADGTQPINLAAINAFVDGTPGTNDMPGRLVFSTTADGASSPTERMRITNAGNILIGTTTVDSTITLRVGKNLTGGVISYGIISQGTIQSDVTTTAHSIWSQLPTAAAAFTLTNAIHYRAVNAPLGAGSAITNQFGFYADSALIEATNNYGFYSNIGSGTGRWNFYANGTADSYFASNNFIFANGGTERARVDSSGRLLVGTSSSTALLGYNSGAQFAASTGTVSFIRNTADAGAPELVSAKSRGSSATPAIVSDGDGLCLQRYAGYDGAAYIEAARITAAVDGTPGTNDMPGRLMFSTTADGASSPTERLRIDKDGRVGIGNTPTVENLGVNRNISGGATAFSIYTAGVIQPDVTTSAQYYVASSATAAVAFTLSEIRYFNALQGTFGAGSTVTNQYGFITSSNLIGATNNYGFYSNIPSGTGRWNFYANNTADSYFASNNFIFANGGTEKARVDSSGRLLVGTSASISEQFSGQARVQTAGTNYYGFSSFQYSNDGIENVISICKSRGASVGSHAVLQANDNLGMIRFQGSDGAAFVMGASITAAVDGTPGTNDMPGRLVFSTTADGASSPTEQWRINNAGTVIYNQPAPAAVDTTATLTVANLTAKIITSSTAAAVTMTLPLGTSMDTGFAGLYTNMAFEWYVINTGATNAVTVQANTGHTIVGSATVAASNSGKFLSRRTAANTWVTYRLSS